MDGKWKPAGPRALGNRGQRERVGQQRNRPNRFPPIGTKATPAWITRRWTIARRREWAIRRWSIARCRPWTIRPWTEWTNWRLVVRVRHTPTQHRWTMQRWSKRQWIMTRGKRPRYRNDRLRLRRARARHAPQI